MTFLLPVLAHRAFEHEPDRRGFYDEPAERGALGQTL